MPKLTSKPLIFGISKGWLKSLGTIIGTTLALALFRQWLYWRAINLCDYASIASALSRLPILYQSIGQHTGVGPLWNTQRTFAARL